MICRWNRIAGAARGFIALCLLILLLLEMIEMANFTIGGEWLAKVLFR